jgi:phosphoribosylglycinamide formyltransferase-1
VSGSRLSAVVLISGGGTNLQALIDAVEAGQLDITIRAVLSNRPDAYGLTRAREAGIETRCIAHESFEDRDAFDAALAEAIAGLEPDIIILAGFMRILSADFVARFEGRILNIHPSLLPKYPGLNTHQRALDAGDAWHGVTVHFVTAELDGGPPIIQARVPILPGDDADTLAARVLEVEHRIYPEAVRLLASGRLEWREHRACVDGEPLEMPLQFEAPSDTSADG